MKRIVTIVAICACFTSFAQNSTKDMYVCTPCGYDCDLVEHTGPGQCSACGMTLVKKSTVHFENIDFSEMCRRVNANKNLVLLDVRSPGEFSGETRDVPSFGHFKKAINVNVNDLAARLDELRKYANDEIIVYCSHSHRSPRATYLLTNNGFKNVTNVSGGVSVMKEGFGDNTCLKEIYIAHEY